MRHIELINSMKREKNNLIPLATVKTKKNSINIEEKIEEKQVKFQETARSNSIDNNRVKND